MVLLEELQGVLSRSGAYQVGERYYGIWQDYPFSLHIDRIKEPGGVTFDFRLPATLEGGLFKEMKKSLPKGCQWTAAGGSRYRLACAGGPLKKADTTLSSVLSQLTRGLRAAGVAPTDVCPLCHRAGTDAYADVGGYTAVHRACVDQTAMNTREQAENALHSGNYVTGLIGAVIGGLVACIPTVIVWFMGYLVGWLYALVPLGAYYGYKLFKGRMNRGAFVCTCIASVIHLFTIEQLIFYFMIHQEWDIWPSIFDTFALYWSFMSISDAFSDMAMSIVFMVIGLWISWDIIRRNAYTDLGMANEVKNTLRVKAMPYDAADLPNGEEGMGGPDTNQEESSEVL